LHKHQSASIEKTSIYLLTISIVFTK